MKKYKVLSTVLLVSLVMAGCGSSNANSGAAASTDKAETATAEEAVKEETKAEETTEIDNSLISNYDLFEVTSANLNGGKWDDIVSYTDKGSNHSPELSWESVDGASSYVVYMVDTSMVYWVHWKSEGITETSLPEGWASETEYIGPYPPEGGTHTYEIYVIALKNPVERVKGSLNGQNPKFESFLGDLDTDADGNTGNVVGAGHIVGTFTN